MVSRALSGKKTTRRGGISARVLAAFGGVLIALSLTTAWGVYSQTRAIEEVAVVREGYVPILLSLQSALQMQNLVSTQLNHITDAKNPADTRQWLETQRRLRPLAFAAVRIAIAQGLSKHRSARQQRVQETIGRSTTEIEQFLQRDEALFRALYAALERQDKDEADRLRSKVLAHELTGARRLRKLTREVELAMDRVSTDAADRAQRAIWLLAGLTLLTIGVGVAMGLYVRRLLAPLSQVTARAKAVAAGDLTPQTVEPDATEIGELATTFEAMVGAIGRARSELVQAERLAAVGRMAAQVTHEIRNPISAIGLNLELLDEELQEAPAQNEEAQSLVSAIRGEVDRLSDLSEHYLQLARRPKGQSELLQPARVIDSLASFVEREMAKAGLEFRVEHAAGAEGAWITADSSQLRQALLNLLRNAREATGDGGTVEVQTQVLEGGFQVQVSDTGQGIPDEVKAHLFDPFFTTKAEGTGLGLVLTQEIVETHGGSISCEDQPSGGTRFVLRFPLAEPPSALSSGGGLLLTGEAPALLLDDESPALLAEDELLAQINFGGRFAPQAKLRCPPIRLATLLGRQRFSP